MAWDQWKETRIADYHLSLQKVAPLQVHRIIFLVIFIVYASIVYRFSQELSAVLKPKKPVVYCWQMHLFQFCAFPHLFSFFLPLSTSHISSCGVRCRAKPQGSALFTEELSPISSSLRIQSPKSWRKKKVCAQKTKPVFPLKALRSECRAIVPSQP